MAVDSLQDTLARVRRALLDDFERDVESALRVAVLLGLGYTQKEIGRMPGLSARDVRRAMERLERIAVDLA